MTFRSSRRRGRLAALAPLLAALAAVAFVAAAGVTQARLDAAGFGQYAYGFFADRYPLFFPAIAYGAARVALLPVAAPGWRGWLGALLGLALVLGLSLHPTYGGLVLRTGYSVGSVAFLSGQTMLAAQGLGLTMTAMVFGFAIGVPVLVARGLPRRGDRWRGFGRGLLRLVALAFAFALLAAARDLGLSDFLRVPLSGGQAALAGGLVLAAFLPHAVLSSAVSRPSVETPGRRG
ncbi:hypothetical protein FF100_22535 [Methylobacterium terricola]|uniref:Uncharacterized protein n=1 Tax=Methylobacterium terricola TaxID=2583531 RepID=A0A5C4LDG9_9HYPH|nr:hypothetical protein [Methylobacterium terricola]TNC10450.1 hypothetical protein FF100_22535 [Methylobacterium terricola]